MALSLTVDELRDYLGGTGGASPRTFYGLSVADVTITARAITPALAWATNLLSPGTITAKPDLAKTILFARASRHLLSHLRDLLVAGGKVNAYSIGNMSVTKQDVLGVLREGIAEQERIENDLLSSLLSPGAQVDQVDLVVENPIARDGRSAVQLDDPPFGGYV